MTAVVDARQFAGDATALCDHLERLETSDARAVVLHSAEEWSEPISPGALQALERVRLTLVFPFEGALSGPALDLALCGDIRVAGADASIRARKIGSRRLLALLGQVSSVQLFESRGSFDARQLLDAGLVSDLAPAGEALNTALSIAATIASRGPLATQFAKEAIWRGLEIPFAYALRFETDLTLLLQTTKDRAEGVRAFMEKRPPIFTGD